MKYYHGSSLWSFSKGEVDWSRLLPGLLVLDIIVHAYIWNFKRMNLENYNCKIQFSRKRYRQHDFGLDLRNVMLVVCFWYMCNALGISIHFRQVQLISIVERSSRAAEIHMGIGM